MALGALARLVFGSSNDRRVKTLAPKVSAINALEESFIKLSDAELAAKTIEFREELAKGKKLDDLLVPAFATVREAAKRVLGQRHFDVQLIGGMVLHEGGISEMRTGEGKTLMATLPAYLNALNGPVHVVTVNDYLAARDAEWMGRVFTFLGLKVGKIVHGMEDDQRRENYAADITYATNNELGFDYLRDNMKHHRSEMVQRGHYLAIVDEVDSILIDEARTPLIISGPLEDRTELYIKIDKFIPLLSDEHFEVDEKLRTANFTEEGNEFIEQKLLEADMIEGSLYDIENVSIVHHVTQALRAHKLFQKDKDYIVRNGEVVIIDEFTGRMMPGRRFSEGLHQALEAKEGANIQPENRTLASVTFQNYFRMYTKLAGMTGTAQTEAAEFADIYGLEVVEIPTNLPVARIDEDDEVYRTAREKYDAIIRDIAEAHDKGQPVLVGTTSIEKSEILAELLKKAGYTQKDTPKQTTNLKSKAFRVLNARYHEQEAQIVAQAGVPGAITIATNMAGRGTDIQLGGNAEMRFAQELADMADGPEKDAAKAKIRAEIEEMKKTALEAGGLYVIGTERHESRRIDNQLRGRSGRQGDPGRSKFFLSLDDDLMRIFGSDRMDGMLTKLGLEEGEAIVHRWINKALEKAQQKVEARNFDMRKNILKYDDVMNDQRKVIFEQRLEMMDAEDVAEIVADMRHDVVDDMVSRHIPEKAYAEQWDVEGLQEEVTRILGLDVDVKAWAAEEGIADEEIRERLTTLADEKMAAKVAKYGAENLRHFERFVVLRTIDNLWREHLAMLDHLRQAVGLRGFAQRDPLNEYKTEAFTLFERLLDRLREEVTGILMHAEGEPQQPEPAPMPQMVATHIDPMTGENEMADGDGQPLPTSKVAPQDRDPNQPSTWGRVGRNEPCPCGSGKKFKQCHGAIG